MLIKKSIVTLFSTKYQSATITYCNKKNTRRGVPLRGMFRLRNEQHVASLNMT